MNIKDVLLGLTTYPKSSNIDAIRWAVSFAELMNCRIAAFAADVKIEVPGSLLGNALVNISALAGAEMKKSKDNARSLLAGALTARPLRTPRSRLREASNFGKNSRLRSQH